MATVDRFVPKRVTVVDVKHACRAFSDCWEPGVGWPGGWAVIRCKNTIGLFEAIGNQ